ncbi:hypothetical protein PENANT_c007G06237 [Penicillium antarcticum]|uniref:Uncharacterized protein n=1 Tax=Penicillium antarcticum TaxID=416450 RepID=A0A1V6QBD3_9EURO|nr:hypothetical protein PENANT_c007G06237 [Penicillium antarcticum]
MALRLPGGVSSPEDFWEFLINKKDGLCEVPETRYKVDSFYHESKPHSVRTKRGYFLQEDPAHFDAPFFSITAYEASRMDPQQRKLLEIVWECFESAGETDWRGKDIGCFVGTFGEDWLDLVSKDPQSVDRYHVLGTGDYALANRISYEFDIQGPSMTLRTGCSASLVGLHEACQALYSGECSSAIVAGANLIMTPTMTTTMSSNLVLSPAGVCRTFDEKADGYGRGEAVNALYIKPLSDALRDNDPIRAVIRSTSTNCDGHTPSITTPGSISQEKLVRKAYEKAMICDMAQTAFFECHGTGTIIGDTAETTVVAKLFHQNGILMGAVKPNVGHSEGASGITSMIKAVLSLEHKTIPPNIFFDAPNPKIPFKEAKLQVPLDPTSWPSDRAERISINCFGIGGTNVHVILDSTTSFCGDNELESVEPDGARLLVVSAKSADSLQARIQDVAEYANTHSENLHNLAYTLGVRREHLEHRAFAVARPEKAMDASSFQVSKAGSSDLTWVFTGQGAQWPAMGKDLIHSFETFRNDIKDLDEVLQDLNDSPEWSLEHELCEMGASSRINKAEFSQPLCTALQIGLVNILKSWGVKPSSVVGHSSGEIAAAYAAGAITARTAIIIAYYRGKMCKSEEGKGAMAAVGLNSGDVAHFLHDGIVVACENSPQSVTISGDQDGIERTVRKIKEDLPDVLCRRLRVNIGYHSYQMRALGALYESAISQHVKYNQEMLPMFSSVTLTTIINPTELSAGYWRRNLESPVLFSGAVSCILRESPKSGFLEVGPHSALSGPLRQISRAAGLKADPIYIPTLTRNDHDSRSLLLSAAGLIHSNGLPIDLLMINGSGITLPDLPAYPWQHNTRYWHESRATRDWRLRGMPHHEVLGARVPESSDLEPSWRNLLRLEEVPWIWEHVLEGQVVFPAAGYIAMAGEAIQQLSPSGIDYSIRNIFFKSPLSLRDEEETELITTLRPVKFNDLVDSEWYAFTITAHDGVEWIKHCHGEVRAHYDHSPKIREIKCHARPVDSEKWYKTLAQRGLDYGPQFRGLTDISVSPIVYTASASVCDKSTTPASRYTLHPTVIDQCLQLMSVATAHGMARNIDRMAIPAAIEYVYIGGAASQMRLGVEVRDGGRTNQFGDATLIGDDIVSLSLTKAIFFSLDNQRSEQCTVPLISEIRWAPDIDLLPTNTLLPKSLAESNPDNPSALAVRDLAKVSLLYILETCDSLVGVTPEPPHLVKWKSWVNSEALRIREGKNAMFPESQEWASMDSKTRQILIKNFVAPLQKPGGAFSVFAECMQAIYDNSWALSSGKMAPLELLMAESRLERYYASVQPLSNWSHFLSLIGHSNPRVRVLEIGAGTGSATRQVLKHLQTPEGSRLYSEYVFTDLSPGFLVAAEEKFAGHVSIEYKILDITKDPKEQGFDLNSFDLVIASNDQVLHATPQLSASLAHVHMLLAPNGRLLLHELHPEILVTDYTIGILPGWWLGESDGRPNKPYVSPERWDHELRAAGFTGNEAMAYDVDPPYQSNFTMLSSVVQAPPNTKEILLLVEDQDHPSNWAMEVADCFRAKGHTVDWGTLADHPPSNKCIVSLLESNSPFLSRMEQKDFGGLQKYITNVEGGQFLWVTKLTQTSCADPRFGFVQGFIRALRHEMTLDISTFESDIFDDAAANALVQVYEKIQGSRQFSYLDPEYEFVFEGGAVHVSRCHWASPMQMQPIQHSKDLPKKLDLDEYGLVDTLHWTTVDEYQVADDQVEVDIHYTALNFRDVMVIMGVVGDKKDLGIEGSGIVRRVGANVTSLLPGDKVAITSSGIFGDQVVISHKRCFKLPDTLSLEDAATMPSVYATAIYSFIHLGMLRKEQTVLIHSACGGVGLAAISICQLIGAEIFATVGSEEKVQYLIEHFGISRNRIFNSRSAEFLPAILRETNGRGVDLVLNSLAGKLLHASWECVASFGRMIELGKRDFLTNGVMSMTPFGKNRAFFGVDLVQLGDETPQVFDGLISQFLAWYEEGKIGPIRPVKVFDASEVVDAFRYMQQGIHMGKILLKMPEDPKHLVCSVATPSLSFSADASYLLVGGLGGLGRLVSTWMVEHGARHLVFLSRSAGKSKDDQTFIHELEVQGCKVICVAGSVTSQEDVNHAVSQCGKLLAGVIQMSSNLRTWPKDRIFSQMTYEDWNVCLAPKVQGTWNLHHAVSGNPLDFFVVFGSASGTCGFTGQSNYAAANTFLDSFTQYRRQLGLPSSVLRLGPVEDAGLVSRDPNSLKLCQAASIRLLGEKDVIEGLQLTITQSCLQSTSCSIIAGVGNTKHTSDPTCRPLWVPEARFALYLNLEIRGEQVSQVNNDELKSLLQRAEQNPAILSEPETEATIRREIAQLVTRHLAQGQDMDDDQVANMVIDSLMSIEIRSWVRRNLRIEVSLIEISKGRTVGGLAGVVIQHLKAKYSGNMDGENCKIDRSDLP